MKTLLESATRRALDYIASCDARPVAPDRAAVERAAQLGGPLPQHPTAAAEVLRLLDELGSPATVVNASGRYFGFVNGGTLPAALAANWLAGAWDQNAGLQVSSPVAARLEDVALDWIRDLLKLPGDAAGGFVTGATMANFCALAAARHALLARHGWDVEADGLSGAPALTVVVGDEVHVSLLKALALLGLGRERVRRVAVDGQGRMRADALPPLSASTILCLQAGNVNSGAFDPAAEIIPAARAAGAWVHVDGAFGLWTATAPGRAHLVAGFEAADSWATDAHKWLNVPYDSGLVLCREARHLHAAMVQNAAYLPEDAGRDPSHFVPEMSRRARGVEIWAALRSLGREGVAELIERTCTHARRFAEGLAEAGCEILNEVVINQVLVCFDDDDTTRRVIDAIQRDGTCWCGATVWQGRTAMRVSVSSWATTEADVERSLEAMRRAYRRCAR